MMQLLTQIAQLGVQGLLKLRLSLRLLENLDVPKLDWFILLCCCVFAVCLPDSDKAVSADQ